jgi:hypothetical protein
MAHVPDPGQGEREDRGQAGQTHEEGRHKGLAKSLAHPGPAGLCFQEAEGGGVCGRLFLAWVPPLLPAAQAEPGILECEDRGEPEKGSIGKRTAKKAGVESDPDQGVPTETFGPDCRKDPAGDWMRMMIKLKITMDS